MKVNSASQLVAKRWAGLWLLLSFISLGAFFFFIMNKASSHFNYTGKNEVHIEQDSLGSPSEASMPVTSIGA